MHRVVSMLTVVKDGVRNIVRQLPIEVVISEGRRIELSVTMLWSKQMDPRHHPV
jgi:hypothetical protein